MLIYHKLSLFPIYVSLIRRISIDVLLRLYDGVNNPYSTVFSRARASLGLVHNYVVLRSVLFFLRSPKNGIAMFLGYLEGAFSDESRAEPEVRRFTGKIQNQNLLSKIGLAEKVNYL